MESNPMEDETMQTIYQLVFENGWTGKITIEEYTNKRAAISALNESRKCGMNPTYRSFKAPRTAA